jgi:hypothetical protein
VFTSDYEKFSVPATKDALEKTVKALQDKKHNVKVVENEKEAVEFLGSLLKDGMSVSMGTSRTLAEIGFIDYLKTQDSRIINIKGQAAVAAAAGKMQEHNELLAKVCVLFAETNLGSMRTNQWKFFRDLALICFCPVFLP